MPHARARDELIAVGAARSPTRRARRAQGAVGADGDAVPARRARGARSGAAAPAAVLVAHRDRRRSRLPDRAARVRASRPRSRAGRRRVATELRDAQPQQPSAAARALGAALGVDVVGDLAARRRRPDRPRAVARLRSRARLPARLPRGRLRRGVLPQRRAAPRARRGRGLSRARSRSAPDLDRELGDPLARAATDALDALARRLDHWGAVVDVQVFDLEVGVGRALEIVASRL